jgi:hypothetical protein
VQFVCFHQHHNLHHFTLADFSLVKATPEQYHDYNFTPNILRDAEEMLNEHLSTKSGQKHRHNGQKEGEP